MKIIAAGFAVMLGLAGAAIAAGWDDLFNGRDLDGWEAQSKVDWQVKDGAIVATKGAAGLLCLATLVSWTAPGGLRRARRTTSRPTAATG